ncbi:MAG: NADH-quinone oxidoreductase subunit C, partial [Candidatus Omnitrophota bacterium]
GHERGCGLIKKRECMEQQTIIDITLAQLVDKVRECQEKGMRLVQICCTRLADKLEIHYSFDLDFEFTSYRLTLANTDTPVPSVSGIYLPAFLYENEIHDLFGVKVEGMAIDFKGKFYQKTMKTPFNPAQPSEGAKP